jgi:tetratricopeptide (TPR) repeat protein
MRLTLSRRPEILFMAALLALVVVAFWRAADTQLAPATVESLRPATLSDPSSIARFQERLRQSPDDAEAAAGLGHALLQRARETGDPSLYGQAEQAFATALRSQPQQLDALVGQGSLALARHQFDAALAWGEQAREIAPQRAAVYGVLTDAYVELGRYDEAVVAAQQMIDIRPDIASYSRVAYLRELHGDLPGAIDVMALAVDAGAPGDEQTAWAQVQLGNLHLATGDLAAAEQTYGEALFLRPDYPYATVGLARVEAARGELEAAVAGYAEALELLPLPEFAIALADLYEALGRTDEAEQQRGLVRAMQQLNAGAGMDVDMELALFDADHGANPAAAVAAARAAYARRPSIHAADALAWALFKADNSAEAARLSAEAMRLDSRDPAMRLRAGLIAAATGDSVAARAHLELAVSGAAALSPAQRADAEQALAALDA